MLRVALTAGCFLLLAGCGDNLVAVDTNDPAAMAQLTAKMTKAQPGLYLIDNEILDIQGRGSRENWPRGLRALADQAVPQTIDYCLTETEANSGFEDTLRRLRTYNMLCEWTELAASETTYEGGLMCKGPEGTVADIAVSGTSGKTEGGMTMAMTLGKPEDTTRDVTLTLKSQAKRVGECAG